MLDRLTGNIDFQGKALGLRSERQKVLASNIANADTPGFQARDFDFAQALRLAGGKSATAAPGGASLAAAASGASAAGVTQPGHIALGGTGGSPVNPALMYRLPDQPSLDGNTVDLDRERANFADNSVRYEATLRFISQGVKTALSAIRGD